MNASCTTSRRRRSQQAGFSLLELLIASVAASVLALTAGSMLVYTWMSWRAVQGGIEMQRDAALALTWMRNRIQENGGAGAVWVVGNTLRLQTDEGVAAFFQQGADLLYDPDLAEAGGEQHIVSGRLTPDSFIPRIVTRTGRVRVDIEFSLHGDIGREITTFRTAVAARN